jgi:hypothetical protein
MWLTLFPKSLRLIYKEDNDDEAEEEKEEEEESEQSCAEEEVEIWQTLLASHNAHPDMLLQQGFWPL